MKQLNITNYDHTDLNLFTCGSENCSSNHSYGPAIRDHYLIHYILKGKGFFEVNEKKYMLHKGQGFLICPDIITYYQADEKDPWNYSWVGFTGLKASVYLKYAGLNQDNPIFNYNHDNQLEKVFKKMNSIKKITRSNEMKLIGLLYHFLAILIENRDVNKNTKFYNQKNEYIKKCIEFIHKNYSRNISISELASYIGLDRSYFYSIFKEKLHQSPQEYLIKYRLNKACELMKNKKLSIGDISRSVGYNDPLHFSRIFKKEKGLPPSKYRANI